MNINFFIIIQPAWNTEWIIAGNEAHNMHILQVKMLAENLKNSVKVREVSTTIMSMDNHNNYDIA